MRPIDADALMDEQYKKLKDGEVLYRIPPCAIDAAPTINPEDLRPKGKWIERVGLGEWVCSECQHEIYLPFGETPEEVGTNYCPSCGARMEE